MNHPKIADELKELEAQASTMRKMNVDMWNIDIVMNACDITDYRTSLWGFCAEVDLTVSITSIEDVTPILRKFNENGYRQLKSMEKVDRAHGGFKWFLGRTGDEDEPDYRITIFGMIVDGDPDDGATCKIVQVGTETREIPIYEVVCEEVLV